VRIFFFFCFGASFDLLVQSANHFQS
jgi:hypothetical protein